MAAASAIFYTKHQKGVTVFINGTTASISNDAPQYEALLDALRVEDWPKVKTLTSIKNALAEAAGKASARIKVVGGELMYTGPDGTKQPLNGPLVDRVIDSLREGATAKAMQPLMRFMDNTMKNTRKDIREELYQFMQTGKMPITIDGCFLAYKKVRNDYKDCHSGTLDNTPGKLVAMPAGKVDANRHNLCSTGLHFCSRGYLSSFGGDRIVVVKVNPRNVFAIPTDYNNTKGRASEYFVVGECTGDPTKDDLFIKPFVFDEKTGAEQLNAVAPEVKFIPDMKVGLLTMAEGYGLVADGKVLVRYRDAKGEFAPEKRTLVWDKGNNKLISVVTNKAVPADHCKLMAVTTKSVRPMLVRAVAKARNRTA